MLVVFESAVFFDCFYEWIRQAVYIDTLLLRIEGFPRNAYIHEKGYVFTVVSPRKIYSGI